MCIQVVERYSACGCLYYSHQVDKCSNYRKRGHDVQSREVLVGYTCPKHSSSSISTQISAKPRRQAREGYQSVFPLRVNRSESSILKKIPGLTQSATDRPDDGQVVGSVVHSQSEVQPTSIWTALPREIDTRHTPSPEKNACPHNHVQSVAACPRECGWSVEQTIERGDAKTDISRRQLHHLLRESLIFAFANLSRSVGPTAVTQSSDPCRGTNSHTITDTVRLDPFQSGADPGASTSSTPQLPTANSDNLNPAECPSAATCHTRKNEKRPSIPPCYLLIFLGFLTVIGSLVPGLWRASSRNDLSGGFSLAQYILGMGIFIVGSMVAIHSKSCECWKTQNRVGQVVGAGH